MTSQVCIDASIALKLVLDEADSDKAHALWASWAAADLEIIAPCHPGFRGRFGELRKRS